MLELTAIDLATVRSYEKVRGNLKRRFYLLGIKTFDKRKIHNALRKWHQRS